jgi:DNA-binding transcriptional LysR family regulator
MRDTVGGTLTVAAPTSFGVFHLAPLVASYMKCNPAVSVQLMLTDRTVDLIDEGFDVAIQIRELSDSSLVARRLSEVKMIACAAPSYLAAHGEPAHPQDLTAHNCLVFSAMVHRFHATWLFGPQSRALTVPVSGNLISNQGYALRSAAVAGQGIVRLPSYIVDEDIAAGRLRPILMDFDPQIRPIYAVYPHREFLASKVRTFIDFLAEAFA